MTRAVLTRVLHVLGTLVIPSDVTGDGGSAGTPLQTVSLVAVHAVLMPSAPHVLHAVHGALPVAMLKFVPAVHGVATGASLQTVSQVAVHAVLMPSVPHVLHAVHGALPVAVLKFVPAVHGVLQTVSLVPC